MDTERHRLNQSFRDLGLRFEWDEATWGALAAFGDLRSRLRHYLENYQPHLLAVYDADFLARLVEEHLAGPGMQRTAMEAHHS